MSRWDALKATLRELLRPAPPVEDPNYADLLRSDEIARTEWVRNHRVEEGGV